MQKRLEKLLIIELSVKLTLQEIDLEFDVSLSPWGEVVKASSPLQKLPLYSLKLMYGDKHSDLQSLIDNAPTLLSYLCPLAALGYYNFKDGEIIKTETKKIRIQSGLMSTHPTSFTDRKSWIKKIAKASGNYSQKVNLESLSMLIANNPEERAFALRQIAITEFALATPVLAVLLKIEQSGDVKHLIYKALGFIDTRASRNLLKEAKLKQTESQFNATLDFALSQRKVRRKMAFQDFWAMRVPDETRIFLILKAMLFWFVMRGCG
ncbi:MAG: hypothetical protein AAF798_15620 [Bacteroidota bacterium]